MFKLKHLFFSISMNSGRIMIYLAASRPLNILPQFTLISKNNVKYFEIISMVPKSPLFFLFYGLSSPVRHTVVQAFGNVNTLPCLTGSICHFHILNFDCSSELRPESVSLEFLCQFHQYTLQ